MPRARKVTKIVDQENTRPENAAKIKSKKTTNKKKDVTNTTATLSREQLKVVNTILNAQSNDASSKKCLADLSKIYTSVSILSCGFDGNLKSFLKL